MDYLLNIGSNKTNIQFPEGSKVIFSCISGSHLYGTNDENSDIDTRGVFIAPEKYIYGFLNRVEQIQDNENDVCYFELKKFLQLSLNANPNILELLFVPELMWKDYNEDWELIVSNRSSFLSRKAKHTFLGYAYSQFLRIKNHRKWLLNPPKKKPERKDFDLPNKPISNSAIGAFNSLLINYLQKVYVYHPMISKLSEMEETKDFNSIINRTDVQIESLQEILPLDTNIIFLLQREKEYRNALISWESYLKWKANRNPKRQELEEKFGYDTKHAMHLVRLIFQVKELFETGTMTFPRPEVDYLIDVKNGKFKYDFLEEFINREEENISKLCEESKLPKKPNATVVDSLCILLNKSNCPI